MTNAAVEITSSILKTTIRRNVINVTARVAPMLLRFLRLLTCRYCEFHWLLHLMNVQGCHDISILRHALEALVTSWFSVETSIARAKVRSSLFTLESAFKTDSLFTVLINLVRNVSCNLSIDEKSHVAASCRILTARLWIDSPVFRWLPVQNLYFSRITKRLGFRQKKTNWAFISISSIANESTSLFWILTWQIG